MYTLSNYNDNKIKIVQKKLITNVIFIKRRIFIVIIIFTYKMGFQMQGAIKNIPPSLSDNLCNQYNNHENIIYLLFI